MDECTLIHLPLRSFCKCQPWAGGVRRHREMDLTPPLPWRGKEGGEELPGTVWQWRCQEQTGVLGSPEEGGAHWPPKGLTGKPQVSSPQGDDGTPSQPGPPGLPGPPGPKVSICPSPRGPLPPPPMVPTSHGSRLPGEVPTLDLWHHEVLGQCLVQARERQRKALVPPHNRPSVSPSPCISLTPSSPLVSISGASLSAMSPSQELGVILTPDSPNPSQQPPNPGQPVSKMPLEPLSCPK